MPSTAIEHFGYDEAARELYVTFVGGAAYTYYGVPKSVYSALRAATSKGRFLNMFIKDRYDFRRHAKSA
jgi:KTSC domain-containing protein